MSMSSIFSVLFSLCLFILSLYGLRKALAQRKAKYAALSVARHFYPLRCPYCGASYEDRPYLRELPVETLVRCSDRCLRHYYFDGHKGRTPAEAQLLAQEEQDAQLIKSPVFQHVKEHVFNSYIANRHRNITIVFTNTEAYYKVYANGTFHKHIVFNYARTPLQTEAGRTLLAIDCMNYAQRKAPKTAFDLLEHGFAWKN